MGNMIPHGDRLHECTPGCPEAVESSSAAPGPAPEVVGQPAGGGGLSDSEAVQEEIQSDEVQAHVSFQPVESVPGDAVPADTDTLPDAADFEAAAQARAEALLENPDLSAPIAFVAACDRGEVEDMPASLRTLLLEAYLAGSQDPAGRESAFDKWYEEAQSD